MIGTITNRNVAVEVGQAFGEASGAVRDRLERAAVRESEGQAATREDTFTDDLADALDRVIADRLEQLSETLSTSVNPFGEEKLLGVKIPLGEVVIDFLEPAALLDQMKAIPVGANKSIVVAVKDTPVVQRYLDWISPKSGPERVPEIRKKKIRKNKASKD